MIHVDKNVFTLHTRRTTYQCKADGHGVLLHTYYGARVSGGDLSYRIRHADRGFSPNPGEVGRCRTYSLDTLPQEYSTCGVGDYRIPAIAAENADGSQLVDLRFQGYEVRQGKYALEGLPAFFADGGEAETLVVTLQDSTTRLTVELYYGVFEGYDLICRAARIINRGTQPVRLLRAASLCLDFPQDNLDFITFDGRHTMEREFCRTPLRPGVQSIGSVRGTSSHQHNPFVMLCSPSADEDHGLCFGAALLYSGGFEAAVESSQFREARLVMGVAPHHFCWTLGPGEAFTTPEAALVCSPDGFASMTHCWHRAVRRCLCRDPYEGRRRPVLVNNWEATYFDFNAEKLVGIAREAAALGIELLVMDDGWFGSRDSDFGGLGDWSVNRSKLPGGLEALVPQIQGLGLGFGLWVEPEMVSEDSALYRAHPDWALGAPGRPQTRGRSQLVLDFTRREVRDAVYSAICEVLRSADICYMKWDMNRSLSDVWSAAIPAQRQGEVYHRYVLGLYEMLERFRREFPGLLIEGCSGGGGRFDLGMLYYTPQIWCSDNTDAVDRLRIQYGTSFCYPSCTVGAHVSASPNEQTRRAAPLETRGIVAMGGTFGFELDLGRVDEQEKAVMAKQTADYKKYYRLIAEGDYYRLSSPFGDEGYTAWAHVSPDRTEALVSLVTGPTRAALPFLCLRLRGLDAAKRYRVSGGGSYAGDVLMHAGYPVPPLAGDYQAVQLYLAAE